MARRPTPPSASPANGRSTSGASKTGSPRSSRAVAREVDVREWASGIRLSGFMVIMLSLVVLGAWVLVPTLGTYIDQRQKIAALEASVQVSAEEIEALEQEQQRWEDPAFITTQARERLYYVKPGEVVYLVDNDLDPSSIPQEQAPVSDELEKTPADWMPQLLRAIAGAGLAQNAASGQ
ncbi:septum formation initiator family protein [Microbacterium sp. TWP3-1-2b2]|uniref:FtsB family cell division protein n=1 Tax=Microbacterium sp. TWP3-1-2b2 TaxID=2804651 RepID=UPI003CECE8B3